MAIPIGSRTFFMPLLTEDIFRIPRFLEKGKKTMPFSPIQYYYTHFSVFFNPSYK